MNRRTIIQQSQKTACGGWCPDCFVVDYCGSVRETRTKEELECERGREKDRTRC